ncbi:MAG: cytochrome o ubiquinol oxidase subunit II [Aquirhabdus sp.]
MSNQPYTKPLRMLSIFGTILVAGLLNGCDNALLNPKGQVGLDERNLIITSTLLMLIVVIPVIIMTFWFAWRYRASNTKATYLPNWEHSTKIEIVLWTIPCIIIFALGILTWESSHALDPSKPIASSEKPIVIDVVALDWKWLFIYPEQGIATVNEIAFPVNVPVEFHITSGTVMNAFFIPQLGSQIYAMGGMENKLNLIANQPGTFPGLSANYSGHGFSDMKFNAISTSRADFDAWVNKVKQSPKTLDISTYSTLTKPSEKNAVEYFATFKPSLFRDIMISSRDGVDIAKVNEPKVQVEHASKEHSSHADMEMSDSLSDMQMSSAH